MADATSSLGGPGLQITENHKKKQARKAERKAGRQSLREQATLLNSGKPIESEEINITTPLDSLELEHQHKKVKKAKKLEKSEKIVKPGSKDKEEQPATTKQATRQAKQDKSPKEKRAKRRDDERATGGKGGPEPANGASHGGRFPQPPPRTLDSIESRLKQHAKAFDGLLSLIPAKFYYGEDKTDQWKRKRLTAEEARAARVAKFDPRNVKSAKDVLDEKQRAIEQANQAGEKRKRDFNDDGDIDRKREDDFPDDMMISDTEGVLREQPGEGLKRPRIVKVTLSTKSGDENPRKDSKADSVHVVGLRGPDALPQSTREARDERKRIRRAAGNERKQKRKQEREEKVNEALRKLEKDPEAVISRSIKALVEDKKSRATARQDRDGQKAENEKRRSEKMARKKLKQEDLERKGQADIMMQDLGKSEGLADPEPKQATSAVIVTTLDRSSPTDMSIPPSPIFDTTMEPSASSVSSTLTLNEEKITKRTSDLEEYQQPLLTDDGSERAHVGDIEIETETLTTPAKQKRDPEVLKRKLAETIAEMRKARKAVGSGSEPRSRQELLDQRARKELAIRERKREQKKQAREVDNTGLFGNNSSDQEPSHADEREAVQSLISKPLNNFQFGNVAFDNGEKLSTSNPDVLIQVNKRKGRSDPVTALQALTAKHQRLDAYDPKKRSEIEEKDLWLNAKKRAQGEKIHDDLSLVKRTVKRLEKGKEKSGKEWEDRKENVKKGIEMRQKKREENLRKRRDERVKQTSRSSRGGGGSKGSGPPKKRAGFEGSFTGRSRKK